MRLLLALMPSVPGVAFTRWQITYVLACMRFPVSIPALHTYAGVTELELYSRSFIRAGLMCFFVDE
jgi:hypothetical protein